MSVPQKLGIHFQFVGNDVMKIWEREREFHGLENADKWLDQMSARYGVSGWFLSVFSPPLSLSFHLDANGRSADADDENYISRKNKKT